MTMARLCRRCGEVVTSGHNCRPTVPKEEKRLNSHQRGYDHKWRAFRKRVWVYFLRTTKKIPVCAECGKPFQNKSPHFDHIEPVNGPDDPRFYDVTNIQLLHVTCHAEKTARDKAAGKTRRQ